MAPDAESAGEQGVPAPPILLRRIAHLATFDDDERELRDVDLLISNGAVEDIGVDLAPPEGTEVVDASDLVVLPGLVNAHQHLYQVGFRGLPELERVDMSGWLAGLHSRTIAAWSQGRFTPDSVGLVAKAGLAESLLSGTTTVADQHYTYPGGDAAPYVDSMIESAVEVGIRLHAGRGSMTLGSADGGSVPDAVCQRVDAVLEDARRLIETYHDPDPLARIRIDLAPCGVHTDRPEMYREFAAIADTHEGVGLHTHLYQEFDTRFCFDTYGKSPWQFLGDVGWQRPDAWLAHMVDAPPDEIPQYAEAGVGIVHVPAPDLRLGWGLAPLREYLDAGCKVGFGTTGSASNDGCNQLADLRLAALAHRTTGRDPHLWPSARELLRTATRGSADCLNRPLLGRLAPGSAGDVAAWSLAEIDRVGIHDPLMGLVLSGISQRCSLVVVAGKIVVRDGRCVTIDESRVARQAASAMGSA